MKLNGKFFADSFVDEAKSRLCEAVAAPERSSSMPCFCKTSAFSGTNAIGGSEIMTADGRFGIRWALRVP